ncbi:preprotein translocase subunit SecE [Neiella marina]|uniref:Protein translocase subunit SecE n=1 Tax=Neiella holothuriorum TaxID=2870530 RepID=A0ABS7EH40_9GAMM|nr:preprotein translocase subunit SecE [Neiella holothuriorum]MBW8191661.1 preprotein translocase subunit SecE [Neiella holothuriorum]
MSANPEASTNSSMDGLKWGLVFILLGGAVVGNYMLADLSVALRVAGVIIAVAAALVVAAQTTKGKTAVTFAKESRTEVRKVVWPTRQEAVQTTLIVFAVTAIMALLLWGLDAILVRVVAFITGVSI